MNSKYLSNFYFLLNEIVAFIALDKPTAAKKFKQLLLSSNKKDLQRPFHFKKSIYFNNENCATISLKDIPFPI